jgi:hypothetical protein
MHLAALSGAVLGALLALTPDAAAQEPQVPGRIQVFLDCQAFGCDDDFIFTELTWVSWVRDRATADVHLLITSQDSGGGGELYTLDFLGNRGFAGREQRLGLSTSANATEDDAREALLERIGLGLVPFALGTTAAERLTVDYEESDVEEDVQLADPWNFWVFEVGLNGDVEGEDRQNAIELEGSLGASRTTADWRMGAELEFSRAEEEFQLSDRTVTSVRENWAVQNFAVKSVGDHWAVGLRADVGKNTRLNQDLFGYLAPGFEYSFFPYSDFARRAVTLQYVVGGNHFEWTDTTLYGFTAESRLSQSLTGAIEMVQPWGEVDLSVSGSQYLHDFDRWRLEFDGDFEVRVFQGFFVNFGGNYQWIRDQLHIPAGDLSDEEILLELQQLATDSRYQTFFGISYRFGSIFSEVVNPRFGGQGGGGGDGNFD